ncbi:tyrosine-type recombinase/integrase [Flavobacterium aquatile]|nr:tyrosine-type recombinase/integrase [Flavobacterium aquatile]
MQGKKFVYSTGEKINPKHWDFQNRFVFTSGKNKSKFSESIKSQLNRYSDLFLETESMYKRIGEEFTTEVLKKAFDGGFKKALAGVNTFYKCYDEFTSEKIKGKEWATSTIKRYQNIKNLLIKFEVAKKYKLTFTSINENFHREFTAYCMDDLMHINNTYSRNLGLLKTFLLWAKKKKYTYNEAFIDFKKVERVVTNQIALTIEDLKIILQHEFDSKKLEKVRDVFVFACVTGMRFGELSLITKSNIVNGHIILKEEKDQNKEAREIPLTKIAGDLLTKYEYKLPLIANQKQNDYLKEVFKELGYTQIVQKVTTKGKENIKVEMPFYDRISTHTARRTFITMMKLNNKSEKLIASITGHKDMRTLNQYYQISEPEKKIAMDEVFNIETQE